MRVLQSPPPPVAEDLATREKIERWLNDQGWCIAYGHKTGRQERGDLLITGTAISQATPSEREP